MDSISGNLQSVIPDKVTSKDEHFSSSSMQNIDLLFDMHTNSQTFSSPANKSLTIVSIFSKV